MEHKIAQSKAELLGLPVVESEHVEEIRHLAGRRAQRAGATIREIAVVAWGEVAIRPAYELSLGENGKSEKITYDDVLVAGVADDIMHAVEDMCSLSEEGVNRLEARIARRVRPLVARRHFPEVS